MVILILCFLVMILAYKLGQKNNAQNDQTFKFSSLQKDLGSFNLSDVDFPAILHVFPSEKKYKMHSYPSDRMSDFNSIYEYKILGQEIEIRLLESTNFHIGKDLVYLVKDNIFLEDDFNKYNENNIFKSFIEDEKKQIQKEIFWHKLENNFIRIFILGHHPEIIGKQRLKDEIQFEINRLSNGISAMNLDMQSLNAKLTPWPKDNPSGYSCESLDQTEEGRKKLEDYFKNESYKKHQIKRQEISGYNQVKDLYLKLHASLE